MKKACQTNRERDGIIKEKRMRAGSLFPVCLSVKWTVSFHDCLIYNYKPQYINHCLCFQVQIDTVYNKLTVYIQHYCIQLLYSVIKTEFVFLFFSTINNKELGQIIQESSSGFQNTLFFYLQKYELFLEL